MIKYFFSYAVGGFLVAIATASFLTEIARLVPALRIALGVFWGVAAIVTYGALRIGGMDREFSQIWLTANGAIALGVCFGLV